MSRATQIGEKSVYQSAGVGRLSFVVREAGVGMGAVDNATDSRRGLRAAIELVQFPARLKAGARFSRPYGTWSCLGEPDAEAPG
jgi:hypothetical protein